MKKQGPRGPVWDDLNYCLDIKKKGREAYPFWYFRPPSLHCAIIGAIAKKEHECNEYCDLCPMGKVDIDAFFDNNCYGNFFYVVK